MASEVIGHDPEESADSTSATADDGAATANETSDGVLLSETVYYADGTRSGVRRPDNGHWFTRYVSSLICDGDAEFLYPRGVVTDFGYIDLQSGKMQYFLRDHLGSVRVIAEDRHTVISRTDYLPFGVRMSGDCLTAGNASARSSFFGFSGKENEMWGGYDTADGNITPHWLKGERYQHFGARTYDPVSCIFMQVDPMAERYYGMTPYGYCGCEPIRFVDYDGLSRKVSIDHKSKSITISATFLYYNTMAKKHIQKLTRAFAMIITWAVLLQLLLTACSQACTQNYFYPDNSHIVNLEPILDRYSALDDKNIESFLDNWIDCMSISSDNSNELDSLFWSIWNRHDAYHKNLCENDIVVLPESIPIYYHDRQLVPKDCEKYRVDFLKWSFPGDTLKMAYTPTLVKCQSRVAYANERFIILMRSYLEESSGYFSIQLPSGTIRICEYPSVTDIHFFRNGILYGVFTCGVLFEYVFLPSDGSIPLYVGEAYFDVASD